MMSCQSWLPRTISLPWRLRSLRYGHSLLLCFAHLCISSLCGHTLPSRGGSQAAEDNVHVEALYMEPVMGEGQPGKVLDRDFYDAARRLTKEHESILVVDSIQAALRARGSLSVVDYPGFEDAEAPDMETYSKAINAGQVPLSILALQPHLAAQYVTGLYGNTMTTNPRALDVATATLNAVTPEVRKNIAERGEEFTVRHSGRGLLCDHG